MYLNTKDIVLVDGLAKILFEIALTIALMSAPTGQMSDILLSIRKLENVLAISPKRDARMMIGIMTIMLFASSEVIAQ